MCNEQQKLSIAEEPVINPELQEIMEKQREKAAKYLVEELNQRFFEAVGQGLTDSQSIVFTDSDGSKFLITNKSTRKFDEEHVISAFENGKHICPNCKRGVAKMRVTFDKDHLCAAIKAFEYAVKNGVQYVQINDIGLTKQEYSKMNRLVKFGLAFRNETALIRGSNIGVYGIPRRRIHQFLNGQWTVASCFLQDPTLPEGHENKRIMSERRITVDQVPSVAKLRETLGDHLTTYEFHDEDSFE